MYALNHRWCFAVAVLFAAALVFAGLLIGGCAGPIHTSCRERGTEAYTSERPTVPFHVTMIDSRGVDSWTADGAPTVLTVHNPSGRRLQTHVVCEPSVDINYIDYGHIEAWPCLEPHEDQMRLTEFMNIDALRGNTCHVQEQWAISESALCLGSLGGATYPE